MIQDKQFDIATALKSRKPLRKTTTATLMEGMGPGVKGGGGGGMDLQQQIQSRLKGRKLSVELGQA